MLGHIIVRNLSQLRRSDEDVRVEQDSGDGNHAQHDIVMRKVLELVPLEPRWGNVEGFMASGHVTGLDSA